MRLRAALVLGLGLALGAQTAQGLHSTSIPITDLLPDDPALAKVIDPLKAEIEATFGQVIVQCPAGLFKGSAGKDNELGYWIADAMRERAALLVGAPVKFGYTNTGGIRANIRPGAVKVADIVNVMPFENELVVAELSGAEVMDVVKEGLLRRAVEPMSGVKVTTEGTVEHPTLRITWSDGSAIDPKEVVKLATSDYLLASSSVLKKSRHPFTTGVTLRQVLLDACMGLARQGKALAAPPGGRMEIAPELLRALKTEQQGN